LAVLAPELLCHLRQRQEAAPAAQALLVVVFSVVDEWLDGMGGWVWRIHAAYVFT
jgi:hypothetical protein